MVTPMTEPTPQQAFVASLQGHLEGLRRTADGEALCKLIARGLKRHEGNSEGIGQVFLTFLHSLLERYAIDGESHPATRIKARLIQQRLIPFLTPTAPKPKPAVAPVIEIPKIEEPSKPAPRPTPAAEPVRTRVIAVSDDKPVAPELDKLSEDLAQQVTQTFAADEKFKDLLGASAPAGELQAFADLKQLFLKGLDELIHERAELKRRLGAAGEYLRSIETERERLRIELTDARKHGIADDVTGLPKREVFVRALEAEVGRVTRYGFSLALALLDIDGFRALNEKHGRAAGDAVLRCYARDVLVRFRTYDLVARFGDDEFIILFPNTQQDGAQRALDKARRAATESVLSFRGMTLPVPSFSSVLTIYQHGEKVPALLNRVQSALAHAKRTRAGASVLALPEQ